MELFGLLAIPLIIASLTWIVARDTITRAEFKQAVQNYASGLQAMGVSPRDLVVLAHTQNLESIYAFWGALLIGIGRFILDQRHSDGTNLGELG